MGGENEKEDNEASGSGPRGGGGGEEGGSDGEKEDGEFTRFVFLSLFLLARPDSGELTTLLSLFPLR